MQSINLGLRQSVSVLLFWGSIGIARAEERSFDQAIMRYDGRLGEIECTHTDRTLGAVLGQIKAEARGVNIAFHRGPIGQASEHRKCVSQGQVHHLLSFGFRWPVSYNLALLDFLILDQIVLTPLDTRDVQIEEGFVRDVGSVFSREDDGIIEAEGADLSLPANPDDFGRFLRHRKRGHKNGDDVDVNGRRMPDIPQLQVSSDVDKLFVDLKALDVEPCNLKPWSVASQKGLPTGFSLSLHGLYLVLHNADLSSHGLISPLAGAPHFIQLAIEDDILRYPYRDGDKRKASDSPGGSSRTLGSTVGGGFLLLFGAALLKLPLYLTEETDRPAWINWSAWGLGLIAATAICQGTILLLSGNWLP